MIQPPRWDADRLGVELERSIERFRQDRMEEPLEDYIEAFEDSTDHYDDLLERTVDLSRIDPAALEILTNPKLLEAFRYLAGPPISTDDLKTLTQATLSSKSFRNDPENVRRVVRTVLLGLDRKRFPWVIEEREPSEHERKAAILASAALMANSRSSTNRRNGGKAEQERKVDEALIAYGMVKVPTRQMPTLGLAPSPGEFCGESYLTSRKADFNVRLWDTRIMPIECKVSNSAVNSVKRLNDTAVSKAVGWLHDLGAANVVPVAVLSGVYKLKNLVDAQARGLILFWAHNLDVMTEWMDQTRPKTKR